MDITHPINSLNYDMGCDDIVIGYLADDTMAREFYAALCNMQWCKIADTPEDELIIDRLKGINSDPWSCSWRAAGAIIADIRNMHYNKSESYIDFFCSGNEGIVSFAVEKCFRRMGWVQMPWST